VSEDGIKTKEKKMATVTTSVAAPPERVFQVLANGWYYSNWVVGTSHVRAVDAGWPEVGSKLFHASGIWPLALRDETEVEDLRDGEKLVLIAKARFLGDARVELSVKPEGTGSIVTMTETPINGPGAWAHNPASERLLRRRNLEALARLSAIVEQRRSPSE
jgi:uncharacterized protein YndB with AHSA1/START domain